MVRALENDGDPDGDLFGVVQLEANENLQVVPEQGIGFFVTLNPGAENIETFGYRISDGTADSELATVVVTRSEVSFLNAAPVANDDGVAVRAGVTSPLFPLRNDFDPEGGRLEIVDATSDNANVTTSPGEGGLLLNVTVLPGITGFTINYVVADEQGNQDAAQINVSVVDDDTNTQPTARSDAAFTREDVPVSIDVTANDDDPESDRIILTSLLGNPRNGSAVIVDGEILYTPNPSFRGSDSFRYLIEDTEGAPIEGFVQIVVLREPTTNTPPIAVDDEFEVEAGTENNVIQVRDNDRDPDGDITVITEVAPNDASVSISDNASALLFTPPTEAREEQTVSFVYTISDQAGGQDSATVSITILPTIQPIAPTANPDFTGPHAEGQSVAVNVLDNDEDEDGNPANLTIAPITGALVPVSINAETNELEFIAPGQDFQFTYSVTDADGLSSSTTVDVQVVENLAPIIGDTNLGELENNDSFTINLLDFVQDPEGDGLTFSSISSEPGGSTIISDGNDPVVLNDGSWTVTFQPGPDFRGASGFSFVVTDSFENQASGRISFILPGPQNEPPVATNGTVTVVAGTPQRFNLAGLFTDPDPGDSLSYEVNGPTSDQVTLTRNNDDTITLQAPENADDSESVVTVTATDDDGASSDPPATLTINVVPSPAGPPITTDDGPTDAVAGEPVRINVLTNDRSQLSDGTLTLVNAVAVQPEAGQPTSDESGNISFTPSPTFSGTATIRYVAQDSRAFEDDQGIHPGRSEGLWTVQVIRVPDAPTGLTAQPTGPDTVALNWNAPANNGGAQIEDYVVRINGTDEVRTASAAPTWTATNLEPGTEYFFEVWAVNQAGVGLPSARSATVIPDVEPGQPGRPTVTLSDTPGELVVTWIEGENPGSDITEHRVSVSVCASGMRPGPIVNQPGESVTLSWDGLPIAEACRFSVVAVNNAGESPPSAASEPECPVEQPGQPQIIDIMRGDREATVTWIAPESNDCNGLSGFEVTRLVNNVPDNTQTVQSGATFVNATGLTNGNDYSFQITAINRAGNGTPSVSSEVTACGSPQGAPTPTVDRGNGQATVSWTGDFDENGCDISSVMYRLSDGRQGSITNNGTIGELTNGTPLTLEIGAINEVVANEGGQINWSQRSNEFTPAGPPLQPQIVAERCQPDSNALCFFLFSNGDNGAPITGATGNGFTFHDPNAGPFGNGSTASALCINSLGNTCVVEGFFGAAFPPAACTQNGGTVSVSGSLVNDVDASPPASISLNLIGCPGTPSLDPTEGNGFVDWFVSRPDGTDELYIAIDGGTPQVVNGSSFRSNGPNGQTISAEAWACNIAGCRSSGVRSAAPVEPGILITEALAQQTVCAPLPLFGDTGTTLPGQVTLVGIPRIEMQITCNWFSQHTVPMAPDGLRAGDGNTVIRTYTGTQLCAQIGRTHDNRADGGYCI